MTVLRQRKLSTVIAVGYGPGERVTPVADALTGALRRGGPRLRELMRVEDGRYWSYLCANPDCCPADGVRFDVQANPAAAAMTVAGLVAYPDRAALAGTLAPVAGAAARAMEQATGRARAREAELAGRLPGRATVPATGPLVQAGRRAVADALAVYRAGGQLTEDDQLAWLSVVLAHLPVRDDAWSRMDPEHREAHLRLWTDLVRRAATYPHKRIPDMDLDGIDAAFLYPSMGLFAGAVHDPELAASDVPRLQPLARRLLQALSRPAVRHRDAADAVDRSRDRGDALCAPRTRLPGRLYPAQPLQQPNAARPGL